MRQLLRPEFKVLAGRLAHDALLSSSAIFYATASVPHALSPDEVTAGLERFLHAADLASMAMWLVRDNAAMSSEGFYQFHQLAPRDGVFVTRHSTGVHYWDSQAETRPVKFSVSELGQARTYFSEVTKWLSGPKVSGPYDLPRLGRAWYILENSRMTSDVATKVAMYVTCLEALFATATQELAHILSERVAAFLATTIKERREIFANTKDAYKIRSSVLHGDKLSPKSRASLPQVVRTCDQYVRRAFLKLIATPELASMFNGKKEDLEEFFTNAVFQPPGPAS